MLLQDHKNLSVNHVKTVIIISLFPPHLRLYSFTTTSAFLLQMKCEGIPFPPCFFESSTKTTFSFSARHKLKQKGCKCGLMLKYKRKESLLVLSPWQYVKFDIKTIAGLSTVFVVFSLRWDVKYKLALSEINSFICYCSPKADLFTSHLKDAQEASIVMFLDVSNVLSAARQFLRWNKNIHWQRHIPCGCRTYSTEVLMVKWLTCKV